MPQSRLTLHAIGNAHIDPVWLWRWNEGLETVRSTFQSVLDRMNEYPEFKFAGSSAAFYAWIADIDPDMLDAIKVRVAEGRWEIVGGWWIQPDANVPCGESLLRQALYGQRFFQETLGVRATVGYNPDTFGHPGSLPQILSLAGLTRYVFMRPGSHEKELPGNIFRWRSPDGSEVLAVRIHGAYCTWGDELTNHVVGSAAAAPAWCDQYVVFYGVGNHGGGPTKANIESLLSMPDRTANVRLSTLGAFFDAVENASSGAPAPVVEDELQHHARGCYAAHSEVKRENRRVEHLLMNAERLAAVGVVVAERAYPAAEIGDAWKSLLFNQFHDILAGTSLPEAYSDARDLFGHAATIGSRTLHHSLQAIARRVDTRGPGSALLVFNPLPWPVTAPIEVERGSAKVADAAGAPIEARSVRPTTVAGQRRSCFVAALPALGYRLFRTDTGAGAATASDHSLSASPTGFENDFWRISVDSGSGHLVSLYDKRNGVETLGGPSCVGIVLEDPSDTWSHDVVSFRDEIGRFGNARIAVEEDGPVRAMLRIETRWGSSTMVQRLAIYRDIDQIECRLDVNWQEQLKMLKLGFMWGLHEPTATYDVPYGHIVRACDGQEEPGQQWIDVTGWAKDASGQRVRYGVGLTNDSKYGFDVLDAEARISVLRSPVYAHHDPAKLDSAQSYSYIDQGRQTLVVRIVPHAGSWQDAHLPRRAWEANVAPIWVNEYEHDGALPVCASFLSCDAENVVLTVLKGAEDGDGLIVRGYEAEGRETDSVVRMSQLGIDWPVHLRPHEIKTWRLRFGESPCAVEVNALEEVRA